ncbi:MAG: hypothetical protein JW763_05600 [candidate division Zixibacteria bacterium]|nr:hypothetical protein [candidate division Zixibacteria bacterium]
MEFINAPITKRFLIRLINTLTNPTVIVTAFGPIIISLNIIWLKSIVNKEEPLFNVINNPVSEALREHSIQLYTLILAVVIFQSIAAKWSFKKLSRGGGTKTFSDKLNAMEIKELIWIVILLLQLFVFAYLFFKGSLTTPAIVSMYCPDEIVQGLHPPPIESPITHLRIVVGLLAVLFPTSKE